MVCVFDKAILDISLKSNSSGRKKLKSSGFFFWNHFSFSQLINYMFTRSGIEKVDIVYHTMRIRRVNDSIIIQTNQLFGYKIDFSSIEIFSLFLSKNGKIFVHKKKIN